MQELIEYLNNNKVTRKRLDGEIRDERNQVLPQRNAYVLLKKYAKNFFREGSQPRMIALSGLRGVGKTTLTWQTANYVYKYHTKKIFFISIDDINRLDADLYDVINALEKIFGRSLNELDERIMIIIDEVHEANEWQKDLKILYERGKKIFVLTTGSSALLLHSSSDLASRWTLLKIFPFSFPEFMLTKSWLGDPEKLLFPIKGLANKLKIALFYSADFKEAKRTFLSNQNSINKYFENAEAIIKQNISYLIDEYISYHNIARFLPISNKTLIIERVLALFERILLKDIPQINKDYFDIFNRLLFRLALSDEINFQTLSKDFKIKETEVEKILTTLNHAEILNMFLPHGGVRSKTGQTKKAFFMSPSLRRALYSRIYGNKLTDNLRAKLYEDILAMYLKRNLSEGIVSFGYGKSKNPDFVIETMESPVLIEIGVSKTTSSQIRNYGNYRYGIIINSKIENIEFDDKHKIFFIPLKWVLLI
jgi:predicted AAA+ superfamily ATPase